MNLTDDWVERKNPSVEEGYFLYGVLVRQG